MPGNNSRTINVVTTVNMLWRVDFYHLADKSANLIFNDTLLTLTFGNFVTENVIYAIMQQNYCSFMKRIMIIIKKTNK
jgi:hypothetical protein